MKTPKNEKKNGPQQGRSQIATISGRARKHSGVATRLAELERDNAQMRETLDNMIQGVLMFDENAKVVVNNRPFNEMFNIAEGVDIKGRSLHDLLEHQSSTHMVLSDIDVVHKGILEVVRLKQTAEHYFTTGDGRTIHTVHQPLERGGWVVTHEDVTRVKEAEAQIAHLAHHDALTGLPNRVMFGSRLESALRWLSRDEQLAVLFIDLDNFKSINDTLGHQVGDKLLQTVAGRLRGCIRETDEIARLGGDEFVIVQTRISGPTDAALLATRIREAIMEPCDIAGHHVVVDTSIGVAMAPGDGVTGEELIKNADLALYGAKASGRGTFSFFEKDMDARMIARHALERDLRRALVNGEFDIQYQPLVNLEDGRISCCEALLRWNHPERGLIAPDDFIPVAEETGLITRIGEWVIRQACLEAARWPDDVALAINISPVQFRNGNLISVVVHALAAANLPASRLELEITEAILLENTEATLTVLNQLHDLGLRISMDDFGTGYSSLSYLQKFPFNKIKIDRSFISPLCHKPESAAIIRAVTGLAHSFSMQTTAEGVETVEQMELVRSLGCTEMQGHLFSKACDATELAEILAASRPKRRVA